MLISLSADKNLLHLSGRKLQYLRAILGIKKANPRDWQRAVQLTFDYKILRVCQILLTALNILCIISKQQGEETARCLIIGSQVFVALGTFSFLARMFFRAP